MNRGKAIANAYIEEQIEESVLMLDQHGVFKPFDGLLNAAGYYYSLAPEIVHQTTAMRNLYYVNGQGTRGSLVGTVAGLKKARPDTTIIGLRQQEEGHIFGLRSAKQLGKSDSLGTAEELCDLVYDITDREAYSTWIN
jgi:cysteine synthase